jgi:hypothetical protein
MFYRHTNTTRNLRCSLTHDPLPPLLPGTETGGLVGAKDPADSPPPPLSTFFCKKSLFTYKWKQCYHLYFCIIVLN